MRHTYVAYVEGARSVRISLSAGPTTIYPSAMAQESIPRFAVSTFDPRTGEYRALPPQRGDKTFRVALPDNQDWVILVRRQEELAG